MDALGIPPAAVRDANALDLARVRIAEQGLHCSLRVGSVRRTGARGKRRPGGILAGHAADALSAEGPGSRADLLDALVERFNDEATEPSSERTDQRGRETG